MKTQKALLAAGCFWGIQQYFDQVPGVIKTTVGYTGGRTKNPTYDDVSTAATGHAEAVLIEFDPREVSFETLIKQFFHMHDPTRLDRQGPEYRSAIFYFDAEQHKTAVQVRNRTQKRLGKPIVSELSPAGAFYAAEEYHQKFSEKTGLGACQVPYQAT